jgi:hypothetical protein
MGDTKEDVVDKDVETERFGDIMKYVFKHVLEQGYALSAFMKLLEIKMNSEPEWFIQQCGPFFWKHREYIHNKDLKYFRDFEYKSQLEDWYKFTGTAGRYLADSLVVTIKNTTRTIIESGKLEETVELLQSLLKIYCRYVLATQKNNQ